MARTVIVNSTRHEINNLRLPSAKYRGPDRVPYITPQYQLLFVADVHKHSLVKSLYISQDLFQDATRSSLINADRTRPS